jgi:glycosyltransferase involved in cell wall biosynthesis
MVRWFLKVHKGINMENTIKLSAVIITYNEERNIRRCLDSVKDVADEIVVVDSFSRDRTEQVCKSWGVRFIQHAFEGHIEQKNYAMSEAKHEYVLSLDADEALSEELKASIRNVKEKCNHDGYSFNRMTNYCGKWIRHCGWYPDKKVRLWNRRKGSWGGVNPHDKVIMQENSSVKHLSGDLLHYSYYTIRENISQINNFSDIAAGASYEMGEKANVVLDIFLNPIFTFLKKYILQLGLLDGYYGLVVSINSAYFRFLKYAKLRELNKKGSQKV